MRDRGLPADDASIGDTDPVTDLLQRIRSEINERLEASRAAIEETARLEAALEALSSAQAPTPRRSTTAGSPAAPTSRRTAQTPKRSRARRGANREAVLAAVTERPGASAGEIAASAGVAQNVVYTQLRGLVAAGVVTKRELPSGRSGYSLTAAEEPQAEVEAEDTTAQAAAPAGAPDEHPEVLADASSEAVEISSAAEEPPRTDEE